MASKHVIYVRLNDGRVAILQKIDSSERQGKYAVYPKNETNIEYFSQIKQHITAVEFDEYKPTTKQPAKRSKKS